MIKEPRNFLSMMMARLYRRMNCRHRGNEREDAAGNVFGRFGRNLRRHILPKDDQVDRPRQSARDWGRRGGTHSFIATLSLRIFSMIKIAVMPRSTLC
jgi:hypothetical protein